MTSYTPLGSIALPPISDEPGKRFSVFKYIKDIRVWNEPNILLSQDDCERGFWSIVTQNPSYGKQKDEYLDTVSHGNPNHPW